MKKFLPFILSASLVFSSVSPLAALAEENSFSNEDIIKEVAYAYQRQGGQIEYDQHNSRRHISPSPEDATSQHKVYLDCSSFVNACYIESFGEPIIPKEIDVTGSTANFDVYAKDHRSNPDVIAYWEQTDYDTDEEKQSIVDFASKSLQVGDILTYRHGTAESTKGHVYMYVGNNTFLHRGGADSYVVVAENPARSYEASASETSGGITTVTFKTIFESPTNTRYIFKATEADTVKSFSILRPIARGLTPTEETLGRMSIQGLDAEKTSSVYENSSVKYGDIVTYTIALKNHNDKAIDNIVLTDTLPDGTEFVSGTDGVTANGKKLSWEGSITPNETVTIAYDVKIISKTAGDIILSDKTYVNGVKLGNIAHTVSGYTDMHELLLSSKASEYINEGKEFATSLDMAESLYSDALAISLGKYNSPEDMLEKIIDTEKFTHKNDTELSKMLVPHLFGGLDIKEGNYKIPDNERTRLVSESELSIGDIIIAKWSGGNIVYVYVGNHTLLSFADGKAKKLTIGNNIYGTDADNILVSLYAYDQFAVLRPSMISEKNNEEFTKRGSFEYIKGITIDDIPLSDFSPSDNSYTFKTNSLGTVKAQSADGVDLEIIQADKIGDEAIIKATDKRTSNTIIYSVKFAEPDVPFVERSIDFASVYAPNVPEEKNPPAHINDGNIKTRYAVEGYNGEAFFTVDLGKTYYLGGFSIAFYNGHTRKNKFTIEVSEDNETFTKVFDGFTPGDTSDLLNYAIDSVYGRYVRWTGYGCYANDEVTQKNSWNSVNEFLVHEKIESFDDTSSHWAHADISFARDHSLVNGMGDNVYMPENSVTRAEFFTMMIRACGFEKESYEEDTFSDVKESDWFYEAIMTAKEKGIIPEEMIQKSSILPNEKLTREEMCAIAALSFKVATKKELKPDFAPSLFDDISGSSYKEYIKSAIVLRIVNGMGEGKFAPKANITRAQAATILKRVYLKIYNESL